MLGAHLRHRHGLILRILEAIILQVCRIQTVLPHRRNLIDIHLLLPRRCGRDHVLQAALVVHGLAVQIRLRGLALRQLTIPLTITVLLVNRVIAHRIRIVRHHRPHLLLVHHLLLVLLRLRRVVASR